MEKSPPAAAAANPDEAFCEREALRLLPWYVSGQLTEEEHAGVTRALAGSPRLQRELLDEVRLQAAVSATAVPGHDAEAGWARLADAIGAIAPLARTPREGKPGLMSRLLSHVPFQAPLATMATAMLVLLIGIGVLAHLPPRDREGFVTLAQPTPTGSAGPRYLVAFNGEARVADVDGLLREQSLTIVAGPDSQALYVVSATDARRAAPSETVLQALNSHPGLVRFSALAAP
jgi:hypothetical protein